MSMKIREETEGDVVTLYLEGRMIIEDGSRTFRGKIHELKNRGVKRIVIDFGNISYIDSSCIGELVACKTTIEKLGGDICLVSLTKRVEDLLEISKFCRVFNVREDAEKGRQFLSK